MKQKLLLIAVTLIAVAGVVAIGLPSLDPGHEQTQSVDEGTVDEAIELASDYLVRHCDENGQFVYKVNMNPKVSVRPQYNIIRHAGAIYALAKSQSRQPTDDKRNALRRAVAFMRQQTVGSVPDQQDMMAVWSRFEAADLNRPVSAKLGGTGLGLAALVSVEQVEPGTVPLEELQAMGRFLVYMQKSDGSFYSKFMPGKIGRDDSWQSLYYPGEAALGLVMLYEIDPQPVWLEHAAMAVAYLARVRQEAEVVEADNWALLATARLWPLCDQCNPPLPRVTLSRHAAKVCRQILKDHREADPHTASLGGLAAGGRTCPTATRLEGLTAALSFLPEEETVLRAEILKVIEPGIGFLQHCQVKDGPYAGGVPRAVQPPESPKQTVVNSSPREERRRTEIRIDYVQHAMNAMIQWDALRKNNTKPKKEYRQAQLP